MLCNVNIKGFLYQFLIHLQEINNYESVWTRKFVSIATLIFLLLDLANAIQVARRFLRHPCQLLLP